MINIIFSVNYKPAAALTRHVSPAVAGHLCYAPASVIHPCKAIETNIFV